MFAVKKEKADGKRKNLAAKKKGHGERKKLTATENTLRKKKTIKQDRDKRT